MTIALGILATDGLVLAADTQLTFPSYMKASQGKITLTARGSAPPDHIEPTSIVISGAGAAIGIERIRQDLTKSFVSVDRIMSPTDVGEEMDRHVWDFQERHVTPHGKGTLDVWMIVAAMSGSHKRLWYSSDGIVTEASHFAAVGIGNAYATILMNRFFSHMDTLGAVLLAAYVTYEVKNRVDGCGDKTDIVGITRDRTYWLDHSIVFKLEAVFEEYHEIAADLLHASFWEHVASTRRLDLTARGRRLNREMAKILKSIDEVPEWAKLSQAVQAHPQSPKADPSPPPPSQEKPGGSDGS